MRMSIGSLGLGNCSIVDSCSGQGGIWNNDFYQCETPPGNKNFGMTAQNACEYTFRGTWKNGVCIHPGIPPFCMPSEPQYEEWHTDPATGTYTSHATDPFLSKWRAAWGPGGYGFAQNGGPDTKKLGDPAPLPIITDSPHVTLPGATPVGVSPASGASGGSSSGASASASSGANIQPSQSQMIQSSALVPSSAIHSQPAAISTVVPLATAPDSGIPGWVLLAGLAVLVLMGTKNL